MTPRRAHGQRGFTMVEVLVSAAAGFMVLLGLCSVYVVTVRAFTDSTSQASLQRVGALAIDAIMREAGRADSNPITAPNPNCVPGGTTSRTLSFAVVTNRELNQQRTICYYAGNGANGAPAGALCQRIADEGGALSACRNLLAPSQPGQSGDITLIRQTNPVSPFCPRATTDVGGTPVAGGQAIANNVHCLALSKVNGTPQSGDIAFAITDGTSSMTFTASLILQNHP